MSGWLDPLVATLFVAALAAVALVDLRRRIVPNRIVLPAAAAVLAGRTAAHPSPVWLLAGGGAALALLAAAAARPGAMGMGDVKLALLIGAAVGRTVPLALLVAFVAAMPFAVVLVLRHGRRSGAAAIPFAPFLALGGVVALAVGAPGL